ncbi:MAG: VOC family protein [Acidobacteria bacterium]|nr:VOC family protein [Acidobacteriota bacterium]
MQKITTFLMYKENCLEAVDFYMSIFKDSRIISKMPDLNGDPAGATVEIEGQVFHFYNGGDHFSFTQGFSLMVMADTQDEVDRLYDALSEGGEKLPCGWVKDKYGVSWQVTPPQLMKMISDPDRVKADRAIQAMLQMHKIVIADIEAAFNGV